MIYIKIVQTDTRFENQMIGSGLKLRVFPASGSSDFLFGGPTAGTVKEKTGEHYA
jgi:hypothetical protein